MAKTEITVKEYKNSKDYERDARKMLKDGWRVTQTGARLKAGVFNIIPSQMIVVTYERTR